MVTKCSVSTGQTESDNVCIMVTKCSDSAG